MEFLKECAEGLYIATLRQDDAIRSSLGLPKTSASTKDLLTKALWFFMYNLCWVVVAVGAYSVGRLALSEPAALPLIVLLSALLFTPVIMGIAYLSFFFSSVISTILWFILNFISGVFVVPLALLRGISSLNQKTKEHLNEKLR